MLVLVILALTLLGFGASLWYSQGVASRLDERAVSIATNAAPAIDHLAAARGQLLRIEVAAVAAIDRASGGGPLDRTAMDEAVARLHGELAAYKAIPFYPGESARFVQAQQAVADLEAQTARLLKQIGEGDIEGAVSLLRTELSASVTQADEAIERLEAFNTEMQRNLGEEIPAVRIHAARLGFLLAAATGLLALALMFVVVHGIRLYNLLLAAKNRLARAYAAQLAAFSAQLEELIGSSARVAETISTVGDARKTLHTIADEARRVVKADYAGVGVGHDPERPFDPWVFSGLPDDLAEENPMFLRPIGILGLVTRNGRPLRVPVLLDHPASRPLPESFPPMGPFLGVPIIHAGTNVGNLYLTRKEGGQPFTEEDERAAMLLANYVGVSISNAALFHQARAATQAREDLLATVSHDLKNPLSSIRLSSELLLRTAANAQTSKLAERIGGAAQRMTSLINDLLQAAKIEAGVLQTAGEPQDAASLLELAADAARTIAAVRSIELRVHGPTPRSQVLCERDLILRVFSNLIGNAIKFSPEGRPVSIEAEAVGGEVRFTVADGGAGISPEKLPHVFERYWQEKSSDRRGSGLGLYIAKGIVEAHGGRIWVESELGRGTAVHFTLPRATENETPAHPHA